MKRRSFLKTMGAAAGLAAGVRPLFADPADPSRRLISHPSGLPRRVLGRTGQAISIIGFPGLALARTTQEEANRAVRASFESGMNYFDVAPAYGNGKAEIAMGPALQALPRDQVFLSCKTKKRDAAGAMQELEQSLVRLKTDHFELYQLHVMSTAAEVKEAFGPGGAIETLLKAREQGKVRWLGFSAHTKEAALDCLRHFKFETVMYPVNFVEHYQHKFDPEVLALARQSGAAVIAIKPISAGSWKPGEKKTRNNYWYRALEEQDEINLAMRFALSLDPVVSAIPTSFIDLNERSIIAGRAFRPATDTDLKSMQALAEKYSPLFPRKPLYLGATGPHSNYGAHV
ncbi:MAG: aldo/keto reductase [Verrucomicrobia bacterium]|nr:aldo/keto reductase [Verrucomicrobiota bacterium]